MEMMDSREFSSGSPRNLKTLSGDSRSQDEAPHAKHNIHLSKILPRGKGDPEEGCIEFEGAPQKNHGESGRRGGKEEGKVGKRGGEGEEIGKSFVKIILATAGEGGTGVEGGGEGEGGGGGREGGSMVRESEVTEKEPFAKGRVKCDDNANYLGLHSNTDGSSAVAPILTSRSTSHEHEQDALRQEHSEHFYGQSSGENAVEQFQGHEIEQEHEEQEQETHGENSRYSKNIRTSDIDGHNLTLYSEVQKELKHFLKRDTEAENTHATTKIIKTEMKPDRLEGELDKEDSAGERSDGWEGEREEKTTKEDEILYRGEAFSDKTVRKFLLTDETMTMLYNNNNNNPDTKIQLDEGDLCETLLGTYADGKVELGTIKPQSTSTLNSQHSSGSEGRLCTSIPHAGILLAIASSLCFSFGSALVKVLEHMNPMELVVFRFLLMWVFNLPLLVHSRKHPLPKGHRIALVVRGIAGATSVMCHFYAFKHMPIADAGTITFTSPIFVLFFSWVLLKEPCDALNIVLVMVTLSGIVCIAKPPFIFGNVEGLAKSDQELGGLIACLGGVVGQASVYIILRLLKDVHYVVVLNIFCIVAVVMTSCVALISGSINLPSLRQIGFILILGFTSFAEQIFLTKAMQVEHASTVSIARMSSVLFGFLLQMLLFGHYPDAFSISGALMVSSCVIFLGLKIWWKSRKEKVEKQ
ncbi:uncharacterized protein LOC143023781 [Oratosquilla oratoria]|uniref:uncharacterized protein LOC143023781 n=1 Tax=Oratosquilla oratoria TaxID=337810 RepID=UPI003F76E62E